MLEEGKLNLHAVFLDFAQKIKDPIVIKQFMCDCLKVYGESRPSPRLWKDLSLGSGYPGVLILCSLFEKKGFLPEGIAYRYVLEIKSALENQGINNLSLFSGLAGICFAIEEASLGKTRYGPLLQTLQSLLLSRVKTAFLEPLSNNLKHQQPSSASLYDPISGVCGIGRYALDNLSQPSFFQLSEQITKILVQLSLPLWIHSNSVPGWYLPASDRLNKGKFKKEHPNGNFNLGLAHGVTGILAFLSIAYLKGIKMEGQEEAIQRLSTWIKSKAFSHQEGIHWPYAISWEEETEGKQRAPKLTKAGWCYGVPGIARTLFLAGKALNNSEMKSFANRSMVQLLSKSAEEWRLPGPALCHGVAGLLAITEAMSKESEGKELQPKVIELKRILMEHYNSTSPWGFTDIDFISDQDPEQRLVKINKIGFLEGATGIFLTLLSSSDKASKWHLPLMIYE